MSTPKCERGLRQTSDFYFYFFPIDTPKRRLFHSKLCETERSEARTTLNARLRLTMGKTRGRPRMRKCVRSASRWKPSRNAQIVYLGVSGSVRNTRKFNLVTAFDYCSMNAAAYAHSPRGSGGVHLIYFKFSLERRHFVRHSVPPRLSDRVRG